MGRKISIDRIKLFESIKSKMMDGLTIQLAIFECGFTSTVYVYKILSHGQKRELLEIKRTMTTGRNYHIEDIRIGDRVTDESDYE